MTRNSDGVGSALVSIVAGLSMLAIPICRIGPLDTARTTYNFIYGDMPVLKQELTNYCRAGISRENPHFISEQLDNRLRTELRYNFDGPIDPDKVSIEELWDTSENYAKSGWDRFIWADLR